MQKLLIIISFLIGITGYSCSGNNDNEAQQQKQVVI